MTVSRTEDDATRKSEAEVAPATRGHANSYGVKTRSKCKVCGACPSAAPSVQGVRVGGVVSRMRGSQPASTVVRAYAAVGVHSVSTQLQPLASAVRPRTVASQREGVRRVLIDLASTVVYAHGRKSCRGGSTASMVETLSLQGATVGLKSASTVVFALMQGVARQSRRTFRGCGRRPWG